MENLDNRNRIYIGAAIGVVVLLALWMYFRPDAVRVETARAVTMQLLDTIDAEGHTRVKNKFTVTAPVSGKLKRIALREGDNVLRNFLLTEVDPYPPIQLAPSNYNGPNPYAAKVFAPASGTILHIFEKSERFLEVGTPLLEIGDPSIVEVVIDVLSSDAARVRPGARVLVIDEPTSAEPLQARVRIIEPQATTKVSALGVEEKRVDIIADFVDSKPVFGDNYRVDAQIVLWKGEDVLCVPNSALFRSGEEWSLFVVENNRVHLRKVVPGHRSPTYSQILNGIEVDDMVVIHPPNSLVDGDRVTGE